MADAIVLTQKQKIWAAIWRFIRAAIAGGLPVLLSWLAGHPNVKWAGLAPVIMAIGKYLRDANNWDWIPV